MFLQCMKTLEEMCTVHSTMTRVTQPQRMDFREDFKCILSAFYIHGLLSYF